MDLRRVISRTRTAQQSSTAEAHVADRSAGDAAGYGRQGFFFVPTARRELLGGLHIRFRDERRGRYTLPGHFAALAAKAAQKARGARSAALP